MTTIERLLTHSASSCCLCDHQLSVQELSEFRSLVEESLHDAVHCRACMTENLVICRECSCRYTADGICEECAAHEYALAG